MFIGALSRKTINPRMFSSFYRIDNYLEAGVDPFHFAIAYDDGTYVVKRKGYIILVDGFLISDELYDDDNPAEIVLNTYDKYQQGCFSHFSGKYSIIIYVEISCKLIIAVDRFGKKKVAYCKINDSLFFGSKVKDVSQVSSYKNIDPNALGRFFSYNYICAPNTIFNNIYKISPGHYIKNNECEFRDCEYWNPFFESPVDSVSNYENLVTDAIKKSIVDKLLMASCRKPALFLSGGIDSALLCKIMGEADIHPNAYTAKFLGGSDKDDESAIAKKISDYYGINHIVLEVASLRIRDLLEHVLESTDEPMANKTYVTASLLMNEAKDDCDCVFTGDGGDELFFGYPQYQRLSQAQRVRQLLMPADYLIPDGILRHVIPNKAYSILYNCKHFPPEQLFSYNAVMIAQSVIIGCNQDLSYNVPVPISDRFWYERKNYVDLVYGTQAAIRKWNDISDDVGIVHISPILSEDIVAVSKSIPRDLLIDKKRNKIILREIVGKDFPFISKLPKHGFDVPVSQWLRTSFKEKFDYFTSKEFVQNQGIFNYESITSLRGQFDRGKIDYINNADTFFWNYYAFQCWYSNVRG